MSIWFLDSELSTCFICPSLPIMMIYFFLLAINGNHHSPSLRDLYERITPKHAADWKVIGTLLGIPNEELKAIEVGYPTNPKWCCNKMLEKWLEIDSTASWDKLSEAINSPAVSGIDETGKHIAN